MGQLTIISKNTIKSITVEDPSEEEQASIDAANLEQKARDQRFLRDILLAECDWTQVPDSALSTEKKAEWSAYRTALRNLPDHENWPDLTESDFPVKPS